MPRKAVKKSRLSEDDKVVYMNRVFSKDAYVKYTDYQAKFMKENYRQYTFKMSKTNDADIVEKLDAFGQGGDRAAYIKKLIRADIAKEAKKAEKKAKK